MNRKSNAPPRKSKRKTKPNYSSSDHSSPSLSPRYCGTPKLITSSNISCDGEFSSISGNQKFKTDAQPTTSANGLGVQTISTKFYTNLPIMHPNLDQPAKFVERSLYDLGYDALEAPNWQDIDQPRKQDLMHILIDKIRKYEKTNVQIKIDDTTFNCHMIVLQCYSDFFMDLNDEKIVVLPSDKVSVHAFVMIYDWMLSPCPMVKRDGLLELFSAAQFLKIKELLEQCWSCIDSNDLFFEDAAFILYLEARHYGYEMIKKLMFERISKFFLSVVASREFLDLTDIEVRTLLQSNAIGVNSETEVLMSAIRWLNFNWIEREVHLINLIKCVRFCLMTPYQLIEIKNSASPDILKVVQYPEVVKMINDAISYVTAKYWYANDSINISQLIEKLNIVEPHERQWICDDHWHQKLGPDQMYASYDVFLEYLEIIQRLGKNHWKGLKCRKGNPIIRGDQNGLLGGRLNGVSNSYRSDSNIL